MKFTSKFFWQFRGGLISVLLLSSMTGCELVDQVNQILPQPKIELTMQVSSLEPGMYIISGRTNLPDHTNLTLQALRSLQVDRTSRVLNPQPIDSVLAHSQIAIKDGQWQAQIRVHQTTPDGKSIEPWQLDTTQSNLIPSGQVKFVAMTEPKNRTMELQPGAAQVGFASDGKSFLKVEEVVTLAPPNSKTVAKMGPETGER